MKFVFSIPDRWVCRNRDDVGDLKKKGEEGGGVGGEEHRGKKKR